MNFDLLCVSADLNQFCIDHVMVCIWARTFVPYQLNVSVLYILNTWDALLLQTGCASSVYSNNFYSVYHE
jgi:hypothetical protein